MAIVRIFVRWDIWVFGAIFVAGHYFDPGFLVVGSSESLIFTGIAIVAHRDSNHLFPYFNLRTFFLSAVFLLSLVHEIFRISFWNFYPFGKS